MCCEVIVNGFFNNSIGFMGLAKVTTIRHITLKNFHSILIECLIGYYR